MKSPNVTYFRQSDLKYTKNDLKFGKNDLKYCDLKWDLQLGGLLLSCATLGNVQQGRSSVGRVLDL